MPTTKSKATSGQRVREAKSKATTKTSQKKLTVEIAPPTKMKRLTLDLPENLHLAIKLDAVQKGVTMAEQLRELLQQHYGMAPPLK